MKQKGLLLTLLLMLLIFIVACGGQDEEEPAVEIEEEPAVSVTVPVEATLPPPVVDEDGQTPTPVVDTAEPGESVDEEAVVSEAPEEIAEDVPFPWPADWFGYGIQVHGVAPVGDPVQTMNAVSNQLGMDWIKMQIKWSAVYPEPDAEQWFLYDTVVEEAYNHGLNVMASIVSAPEWSRAAGGENGPPDDYTLYYDFLEEVLTRYDGKIQAVEIWNEQNLEREWATPEGLSPVAYVEFLSGAHAQVKDINSKIIVISGALAPTGVHDMVTAYDDFIYLDDMLAAGLLNYADCVGAHHNGYNIGPDVAYDEMAAQPEAATAVFRGPFGNPHHSWSFKTTMETYAEKVQAVDPEMKLCVTEFGWASAGEHGLATEAYEYARDNTLDEQATYIVDAFQQMYASGDVWLAFLFNFDYGNKGGDPSVDDNVNYSIVDQKGIPRPAYGALAGMEKLP
jgi:hypothetical protein